LWFWVGVMRVKAVNSGQVKIDDITIHAPGWPPEVARVGNAFQYQLELPILFYLLTLLSLYTGHADIVFVVFAWVFVALRLIHALVYVSSPRRPGRVMVFRASDVVLAVAWAIFAARVIFGLR
jgi:hypothetical protein